METIKKTIGEGHARGELYRALAYSATDVDGGRAIKQVRFNPDSGSTAIIIGDSTTAITLATYAQRAISIYTTSASADGSNNVLPVYIDATMSGTGGVGRAFEAKLTVSGKLGGWGNALKGYLDVTATNGCAGLISGICAELRLPSASIQTGTYAVLELAWVGQTNTATLGALTGSHTTLIYANVGGGTATDFDSNGYIFEIEGLSDSDGNAWYDNTLRIAIGDTAWYVPLSSAQGSFTTAYPIVSTYASGIYLNGCTTVGLNIEGTCALAIGIGTTTALTTATNATSVIKVNSDWSNTTALNYHVPVWITGRYTADGASTASIYTLRGHVEVEGTLTSASGNQYIIGVHGRCRITGSIDNGGAMVMGMKAEVLDGSGNTETVSHMACLWADWQNVDTVTGETECLYLTHNAAGHTLDQFIYIYGQNTTNYFMKFYSGSQGGWRDGTVSSSSAVSAGRLKIRIAGADRYLYYYA